VGIFASLGVAIGNLSDLANKIVDYNLPIIQAIKILLYKVPEFTAYALPVSVLLATLMAYGRLSSDSELIALRNCGVSLYRIVTPAVVLSLVVTSIAFVFNEYVVPEANYRATGILVESIQEEHDFWQTKDIFYPDYENIILPNGETLRQLRSLLYAEKFDGQKMESLTILKWLGKQLNQIVISDSAQWNDNQKTWDFFDGTLYLLAPDSSYRQAKPFKHQQFSLPKEAFDFASLGRNPYEMNIFQARQYLKLLKMSGDDKKVRLFEVRIQQKLAFPFICLIFGIVGAAIGSSPQHISRGTSFGLSIGIVFVYYIVNFVVGGLGIVGLISPIMAAWFPNLFGLIIGVLLLKKINS
jgi:lipopolysaccharide export system permease protein